MRINIGFINKDKVSKIPLVLFFRLREFESAPVGGARTNSSWEVDVGTKSEDIISAQTDSSWEVDVGTNFEDIIEHDQRCGSCRTSRRFATSTSQVAFCGERCVGLEIKPD
jgi:hypothetical protein